MSRIGLSDAQLAALRLAATDRIQYYKGGWYTTEAHGGPDQRVQPIHRAYTLPPQTLRSLVARGLLEWYDHGGGVYSATWTITDAGRAALAGAKS